MGREVNPMSERPTSSDSTAGRPASDERRRGAQQHTGERGDRDVSEYVVTATIEDRRAGAID
jgi:hypothetical protein